MKNGGVDDEDEDDDEIDDEEEDEDDEDDDDDEEDDDDDEEAETGGGLFGKLRGLTGKLLGQGGDDDDDEDDDDDDDEDEDESPAASPSPPVKAVPAPSAEADAAQRDLTASPEGVSREGVSREGVSPEGISFEDLAPPSPDTEEDLPVNHKALTGLTEEGLNEDSGGAPEQSGLTSEENTPEITAEREDSSGAGLSLGNIFEKKVEIDQNLRNLAMSQEETQAEALATDLHNLFQELEEIMSR
jgi:hypothetical protein